MLYCIVPSWSKKKAPPEIETLNASDDRGKTKFNVYQNPCFSQGDDTLSGQEVWYSARQKSPEKPSTQDRANETAVQRRRIA